MRMKDVNARKAYIANVRRSFDSPARKYEFEKEPKNEKGESADELSFFKVRLIIAALLFAAYIFCDRTNTALYHVTTEEISERVVKDFDYEAAKDEVLQAFHIIREK